MYSLMEQNVLCRNPKIRKSVKKSTLAKKKTTTRKHIVISTPAKNILVLGHGKTGRRHDKRIAERQQLIENIPNIQTFLQIYN